MPTMRSLLVRGMLVGLAAALLAYVVAWFAGEPQVAAAISFEETQAAAAGEAAEPELVSRTVQETIGLLTALLVYGAGLGGFYSIAYAFAHGRLGALGTRATALVVAAAGFVIVYVTPILKYPANPPAVGDPDSIGRRTTVYFTMILIALLAAAVAVYAGRFLSPRLGTWNATLSGIVVYAILVGASYALMPQINEVPDDFSATTLWWFRVASFGIQFVLWGAIGLLFGGLTERSLRQGSRRETTLQPAATP